MSSKKPGVSRKQPRSEPNKGKPGLRESEGHSSRPKAKTLASKSPSEQGKKAGISPKTPGTSFKEGLPRGSWGPNGKPIHHSVPVSPRGQATPEVKTTGVKRSTGKTRVVDASDHCSGFARSKTVEPSRARVDSVASKRSSAEFQRNCIDQESRLDKRTNPRKNKSPERNGIQHNGDQSSRTDANNFLYKVFKEKVQLKQSDIMENKHIVSKIKGFLGDVAKLDPNFPLRTTDKSFFPTGSYYEKVKVSRPNEFDVMVSLDVDPAAIQLEYERDQKMEGYVKLKMFRDTALAAFMTDDHKCLSPIKIRKRFLQLLKQVTKAHADVKVEEHGPAVQLTFRESRSIIAEVDIVLCIAFPEGWPQHAIVERQGLSPQVLEKIKSKGFHVVPKTFQSGSTLNVNEAVHWRVSYSLSEKELLLHQIRIEQKEVLKFVKFLREIREKQLPGLHSFHLKNVFLQQVLVGKRTSEWDKNHFLERVVDILCEVLKSFKRENLCHFFNSRCNLLLNVSNEDKKRCISTIEKMLKVLQTNDIQKIDSMICNI